MNRLTNEIEFLNKIILAMENQFGIWKDILPSNLDELKKYFKELVEYKNLEEQGLLVKLPCKVDDEVIIVFNEHGELFITNGWIVTEITVIDNDVIFNFRCYETNDVEERSLNDFGKSAFLTREEAEKALKEMEVENGEH